MDAVIGHQEIRQRLHQEKAAGRLAHAYLFTGVPHVGKLTAAREFAAVLLCEQDQGPCGECASCLLREAGNHPDLRQIDRDTKAGIEEVRGLKDWLQMRPHSAPHRVGVLADAERLSIPAQNALLKLLEEPPARTVLILTATSPAVLLPTTVSRCRQVHFGVLSPEDLAAALPEASPEVLEAAEGRPGMAKTLISDPEKLAALGRWENLFLAVLDAPPDKRLALAKEVADDDDLPAILDFWTAAHHWALHAEGEGMEGRLPRLAQTIARRFSVAQLNTSLEALVAARAALRYNPNVLLLMENTLLKLGE